MPEKVYMLNGQIVPEAEARISPLGSDPMFAYGMIDRLRTFRGTDGRMRMVGLAQHLSRCQATAAALFGADIGDLRRSWADQLARAALATELGEVYLHLGYGQMSSPGTMLQGASAGLTTFVFAKHEGPLYQGRDGNAVYVSTEPQWPRPDGPLTAHKTHGYQELLWLKNRARARRPDKDARSVEALLLARDSFRFDRDSRNWVVAEDDPLTAECGCTCAFALDRQGNLHLPARAVRYFRGVTVQIVEALFRAYFPDKQVLHDLRRSHLLHNGGTAGTAGGVVPIVEVDKKTCERTEQFDALAALYCKLCWGELNRRDLQEQWAPVIATGMSQQVAVG
ncbi:hypothetical protein HYW17_02635 [Candidatus Uhrbacteria bacterium]|nr:hypothetical protein [Candidatus Uhrbacteria bacterium]